METPDTYGSTIDNDPEGCGDVIYQVECDNVDSSVVYMNSYYTSTLNIKTKNVDSAIGFESECTISAYFKDYEPDASLGQSVWASYTFWIEWLE